MLGVQRVNLDAYAVVEQVDLLGDVRPALIDDERDDEGADEQVVVLEERRRAGSVHRCGIGMNEQRAMPRRAVSKPVPCRTHSVDVAAAPT